MEPTKAKAKRNQLRMAKVALTTTVNALVPDAANRRTHTPRNVTMIAAALREVGSARSIVIDENDTVLAGNGVVEAAAQAGISKVQIVEADGNTIIAVRRRGLTDDQKRALAIYDNRTAELAEWNVDQLAVDQAAGVDLQPFFSKKELAKLLGAVADDDDGSAPESASQFVIIVTCRDEVEQTAVLERFIGEGLACRAVVS